MHTIEIDGHTYSGESLAARLEMFTIALGARRAKAAGRDPGLAQIALLDLGCIVEDQCDDIHRISWGACSCGLVVTDVRELGGHLDLRTLRPARTFVVADHEGWVGTACQACREVTTDEDLAAAWHSADTHSCSWAL